MSSGLLQILLNVGFGHLISSAFLGLLGSCNTGYGVMPRAALGSLCCVSLRCTPKFQVPEAGLEIDSFFLHLARLPHVHLVPLWGKNVMPVSPLLCPCLLHAVPGHQSLVPYQCLTLLCLTLRQWILLYDLFFYLIKIADSFHLTKYIFT